MRLIQKYGRVCRLCVPGPCLGDFMPVKIAPPYNSFFGHDLRSHNTDTTSGGKSDRDRKGIGRTNDILVPCGQRKTQLPGMGWGACLSP